MPNGNPIPEVLQAGLLEALNAPAEKRLEAMISLHSKALETIDEESLAAWDRQKEEWGEALKADPEYGGAKLAESKAALARLYALYPKSAELRKALDDTGMGNHPEIARLLFWAAGRLTEAKPVSSNETPTVDGQTAALNALYPSMATKG